MERLSAQSGALVAIPRADAPATANPIDTDRLNLIYPPPKPNSEHTERNLDLGRLCGLDLPHESLVLNRRRLRRSGNVLTGSCTHHRPALTRAKTEGEARLP